MSSNRTNVRTDREASPFLRGAVRALAAVAPRLAGAALARLFFRSPPRRPVSDAEREVLDRAVRDDLGRGPDRLATWRWGDGGPLVLLVHGWGGSAAQMTPLVAPLVAAGFSVVAFDAPGHGASAGARASIPSFADALARVASFFGPVDGAITHSMGGAAFSLAAARGLEARRAVLVAPPADAATWVRGFARHLRYPARAEPALRRAIEAVAGEPLARLNSGVLGPSLRSPLLVVHDRHDREVPVADGARVAAEARDGRLHVTEGLGHRRILRDPGVGSLAVAFLSGGAAGLEGVEPLLRAG